VHQPVHDIMERSDHDKPMRIMNSPHQNVRPAGMEIDMIVLHAISLPAGGFKSEHVENLFMGTLDSGLHPSFAELDGLKVSAHFVVDRKGSITQFVPCACRAWHAGVSSWQGRDGCNDFSIGIEIIGDEERPFTQAQYRETARLCRVLMQHYTSVERQRIVGHSDIAPGRKWDPGKQWDWHKFDRSLVHVRRLDLEVV